MRKPCPHSRRAAITPIALSAALACAAVSTGACGGHREPAPAASAAGPVGRPAPVIVEGSVGELSALVATLPSELGAAAPQRASALIEGSCALPVAVAERIRDDARVVFVVLRAEPGGEQRLAFGVRLRVDAGATPLGAGVALGALGAAGAPADARWVGAAPAPGRHALALAGDVLVCGHDDATAREAAPYLSRTLVPSTEGDARVAALRPAPRVVGAPGVAEIVDGVVSGELRRSLERSLAELAAALNESARRAAAAQLVPAGLGDPVALVHVARARTAQLLSFLTDVGTARTTLAPGGGGLVVSMRATVRPGSPLDLALDALPSEAPGVLGTLPRGTALAALFPAEPVAQRADLSFGAGLADDLANVTDSAIAAEEATSLRALLASIGAARGGSLLAAVGDGSGGPFALLASGGATRAPAPELVGAALRSAYVRRAAGVALGCHGDARPQPLSEPLALGDATLRTADFCGAHALPPDHPAGARRPRLDHATQGDAWSLAITQTPAGATAARLASIAARAAATLAGTDDGASLANDPDTTRALAALPPRVHFLLAVIPDQLLRASAFFPVSALRHAAPVANAPTSGPPLLLALARDGDTLRLELIAPTAALTRAAATIADAQSLPR